MCLLVVSGKTFCSLFFSPCFPNVYLLKSFCQTRPTTSLIKTPLITESCREKCASGVQQGEGGGQGDENQIIGSFNTIESYSGLRGLLLDERYRVLTFLYYAVMLQGLCLHLQHFIFLCVYLWKHYNRKRKKRGNIGLSSELSSQINKRNKSENDSSRLSVCKIT